MVSLTLPFPPSVNTYWRHPTTGKLAGRHLISEKGREYRNLVKLEMLRQKIKPMMTSKSLSVSIIAHAPDNRRRDLDNLLKAVFDSLTHAGLWYDDFCIDRIEIKRADPVRGGRLILNVEDIEIDNSGTTKRFSTL